MYPKTPTLTHHARERCNEMGVATRRVKQLVRHPDVRRPSGTGGTILTCDIDPDIAAVVSEEDPFMVVTVVWRSYEPYVRDGAGFIPIAELSA